MQSFGVCGGQTDTETGFTVSVSANTENVFCEHLWPYKQKEMRRHCGAGKYAVDLEYKCNEKGCACSKQQNEISD